MNFQNLTFDYVEAPRSPTHIHQFPSTMRQTPLSITPRPVSPLPSSRSTTEYTKPALVRSPRGRLPIYSPSFDSLSPQPTFEGREASTHSISDSTPELYGPDRFFGPSTPLETREEYRRTRGDAAASPTVRFDESQLAMFTADNTARMAGVKDDLANAAGKITPGVDDTPYIQHALEALTRDFREPGSQTQVPSPPSTKYNSGPQRGRGFMVKGFGSSPASSQAQLVRMSSEQSRSLHTPRLSAESHQTLPPKDGHLIPSATPQANYAVTSRWVPVDRDRLQTIDPRGRTYPPLTFKPRILRPFSMMILMMLCIFMMAALAFSAVYSTKHQGLTPYPGSMYSGQYFIFRILPQLLAGIILIYTQTIVAASLRILPFATMTKEDPQERYLALFRKLYTPTFILPNVAGPWQIKAFSGASWLAIFTLPLLSAAFTCVFDNSGDRWTWAATPGVTWAVVAIYAVLVCATAIVMVFWFGRWTGLTWDIRSIGDLIPLLHRTNTMPSYRRKTLFSNDELRDRCFDRLGYWQTERMTTGGIWHTIGGTAAPVEHSNDTPVGNALDFEGGRYLPWCLRDIPLLASVFVTCALLVALLVVSFLPQTRLADGFLPRLQARPDVAAFSAANFIYSFVPALIGTALFLAFQSFDHALRVVQPWGDMSGFDGAIASRSVLADYAACLPLQATWRAMRNGHWRVALTSAMALVSVGVPVLAGGLFMALADPHGQVRMYPSIPVFGVLIAVLILYFGSLCLLIPSRRQFQLPHAVNTIASLISLCTAGELCEDAAFRSVRSRRDLEARLGVHADDPREESVFFFGLLAGRDEKRLSVRRMKRFTEKPATYPTNMM